jgi:hypothetical protein
MVVNLNTAVFYHGILTLENEGTRVFFGAIFITLAPGINHNNRKGCGFMTILFDGIIKIESLLVETKQAQ